MLEMDVDTEEDFSELEARLYGQIHHESAAEHSGALLAPVEYQRQLPVDEIAPPQQRRVTPTHLVNVRKLTTTLANRYWSEKSCVNRTVEAAPTIAASGAPEMPTATETAGTVSAAPPKPPNTAREPSANTENQPTKTLTFHKSQKKQQAKAVKNKISTSKPKTKRADMNKSRATKPIPNQVVVALNKKLRAQALNKNIRNNAFITDLRINPVAKAKAKADAEKRRSDQPAIQQSSNAAPVAQPARNRLPVADGHQKSKDKQRSKRNFKAVETIVLDDSTDDSSDNDDVIVMPVEPVPVFTISDSDDEGKAPDLDHLLQIEENAMDAVDIQLVENASFLKPPQAQSADRPTHAQNDDKPARVQNAGNPSRTPNCDTTPPRAPNGDKPAGEAAHELADKLTGTAAKSVSISRCASPASVVSSDDFIGQSDRSRLVEGNGMADDVDILMLTAEMDSFLESAGNGGNPSTADTSIGEPCNMNSRNSSGMVVGNFVPPRQVSARDYRVDADNVYTRAVDVYESESDITDSVYSKGAPKPTVIRNIASTSDEGDVEQQQLASSYRKASKRFRKRRPSGSIKESETNNDDNATTTDDDDQANANASTNADGVQPTPLPFIAHGVAIEHFKSSLKEAASRSRHVSVEGGSNGHMSDTEFMASLNNLVQGGDDADSNDCTESIDSGNDDRRDYTDNGDEGDNDDDDDDDDDNDDDDDDDDDNDDDTDSDDNDNDNDDDDDDDNHNNDDDDDDDDADDHHHDDVKLKRKSVPSARDIAARVLKKGERRPLPTSARSSKDHQDHQIIDVDAINEVENAAKNGNHATPQYAIEKLGDVFTRIDKRNTAGIPNERAEQPANHYQSLFDVHTHHYSKATALIYNSTHVCDFGWNEEMYKFYNCSWNGERFTTKAVWQSMDSNRDLWRIYSEDRFPKSRPLNNLKCHNCYSFGHTRSKCRQPRKPQVCFMCGDRGHTEPRCPKSLCLRCGNKTNVFTKSCNACTFQNRMICQLCKLRGHSVNFCPDKWRRYHSTTESNQPPNSDFQYRTIKYCCVCGKRGHLADTCRSAVRYMEYPMISSEIKSHSATYKCDVMKSHRGIPINLLYKPIKNFHFKLTAQTTSTSCYGRFLQAVGMGDLIQRKRKRSAIKSIGPSSSAGIAKSQGPTTSAVGGRRLETVLLQEDNPSEGGANMFGTNQTQVQEISESGTSNDVYEVSDPITNSDDVVELVSDEKQSVDEIVVVGEMPPAKRKKTVVKNIRSSLAGAGEADATDFKAPDEPHHSPQTREPVPMDSDSNYSFSEHFDMAAKEEALLYDMPSTSARAAALLAAGAAKKSRPMEALPDFIPLADDDEPTKRKVAFSGATADTRTGISGRYVSAETDDEEDVDDDGDDDDDVNEKRANNDVQVGIGGDKSSEGGEMNIPCEAKIYLTKVHSNYLMSSDGRTFLEDTGKAHNIRARLDWSSVGYVLVIYGLPADQDKFHRKLLAKYQELAEQRYQNQTDSCRKLPKRADVLIRYLRENISLLMNNLGNANEILRRLNYFVSLQSKNSLRLAERTRRQLNMLLVGQAGFLDGSMHLSKLLIILKNLLNDYKSDAVVPNELRDEIDSHWKFIFTSYRHQNYTQLVESYNNLLSSNRLPKLSIDPVLLGQRVLDVQLTAEQKQRLDNAPALQKPVSKTNDKPPTIKNTEKKSSQQQSQPVKSPASQYTVASAVKSANAISLQGVQTPPPTPPAKLNVKQLKASTAKPATPTRASDTVDPVTAASSASPTGNKAKGPTKTNTANTATTPTGTRKQALAKATPPFANPEQKSTVATKIQESVQAWQSTCAELLTEIDESVSDSSTAQANPAVLHNSKAQSTFWSRESIKYIESSMKLVATNPQMLEKLQRVQKKSLNGQLSYNDYRAVIKLYNAIRGA